MRLAAYLLSLNLLSPIHLAWAESSSDLKPRITNLTYNGTGCPFGTANIELSSDDDSLSLVFTHFKAQIGDRGPIDLRRHCQIQLLLVAPSNFAVTLEAIDIDGHVDLYEGVEASLQISNYFSGKPGVNQLNYFQEGMFHGALSAQWQSPSATSHWSICGQQANVNLNLSMSLRDVEKLGFGSVFELDAIRGIKFKIDEC